MKKQICFPVTEKLVEGAGFVRWEILNRFGEEACYGEIYTACLENKCDYVLKYMAYDNDNTAEGITNEVNIQKQCSKLNLCLPVIDAWLCDEGGAMVMNKLDYTMANLFMQYKSEHIRNLILSNIIMLLDKLHMNGFYHGDLHLNNMMVKSKNKNLSLVLEDELKFYGLEDYSYYFIDFGKAGILTEETNKYIYKDYADIYDHLLELREEDETLEPITDVMKIHMQKFD